MPHGEERRGAVCGKIACTVRCRRREETRPVGSAVRLRRLPPTLPRPTAVRALLFAWRATSAIADWSSQRSRCASSCWSCLTQPVAATGEADALPSRAAVMRPDLVPAGVVISSEPALIPGGVADRISADTMRERPVGRQSRRDRSMPVSPDPRLPTSAGQDALWCWRGTRATAPSRDGLAGACLAHRVTSGIGVVMRSRSAIASTGSEA
jgi:hypothetical protein